MKLILDGNVQYNFAVYVPDLFHRNGLFVQFLPDLNANTTIVLNELLSGRLMLVIKDYMRI